MTDHLWVRLEATDPAPALTAESAQRELRLPEGWRIAEATPAPAHEAARGGLRAVGELFAYALLLWPAVVGLMVLQSQGWQLALRIAMAIWLLLMHLTAYRGKGGRFVGTSLLMLSACVAGFWWAHPGPWMYPWLFVILVGLYASVRRVLRASSRLTPGR
jgi:hypothetical protein